MFQKINESIWRGKTWRIAMKMEKTLTGHRNIRKIDEERSVSGVT
jgi:hypothetical protein